MLACIMSSRLNVTFFVALALQMLMIGATAAPLADGLNPMGDYTKMDKALRDSLSSSSEDDIPLTIALSIVLSSFVKNVPKLFEKVFLTCTLIPYCMANSTDLG